MTALAEVAAAIVELLSRALPEADRGTLSAHVANLRLNRSTARELLDHLQSVPDALSSGHSGGPAARLRLLDALAAEHPTVQPARCVRCHRSRTLRHRLDEGRACVNCYGRQHVETCVRCGDLREVALRQADGGAVCPKCKRRDTSFWRTCGVCGKTAPVAARRDGQPLCQNCLPRRPRPCSTCGRDQRVRAYTDQGPLCGRCYQRSKAAECEECGRVTANRRRDRNSGALVCERCWNPPVLTCVDCGQQRPCPRGLTTGEPRCGSCYSRRRPRRPCARCGKCQRIHSRLPLGDVCGPCHTKIRRNPAPCARCAAVRPLIGADAADRAICGPCAGDTREWNCRRCDRFDALFSDGLCPRCVADDRVHQLLSGSDGRLRPQLTPLLELLDTESDPYQILIWLYRSDWGSLLGRLATDHEEITHDLLDTFPSHHKPVQYLRSVLVTAGVLPARDEHLDGIPAWLDTLLAAQPPHIIALIRPYASWSVLRRARGLSMRRASTPSVRKYARSRILIAVRFLNWLDEQQLRLATVTQADVDAWLDAGTHTHHRLRDFLRWAHRRRLAPEIHIPWLGSGRSDPGDILDDHERWQLLRRCLTEEDIPLHQRAAGALVLLYGQRPQRIVTLTRADISTRGERTHLTLDRHPVLLPPPLAEIIQRLAAAEPFGRRPIIRGPAPASALLFPGARPGACMDHGRLTHQLNTLGIRVIPARNSALCALADDLPAPVVADLLGIHITTAVRWGKLVKRDWTAYLAARTDSG
ncbi:hypothetical protein RKE29_11780 [Streptomyces sp. B1866]|uniref:hypothetical protein n=1 Tax=Streptomyces sp. B1866 TaxID=3075431 RepID=UPI00288DD3F9|nr:hypothetical protein [Streptomyces sp. B1866]MDT3397319.1 hypothetical protein [Streptomyces sp. B1866]